MGSKQAFLQHMPQVGEDCGIPVRLKCALVHQDRCWNWLIADRVLLYVRVRGLSYTGRAGRNARRTCKQTKAHFCWLKETPESTRWRFCRTVECACARMLIRGFILARPAPGESNPPCATRWRPTSSGMARPGGDLRNVAVDPAER
jgi:hypothetical protein